MNFMPRPENTLAAVVYNSQIVPGPAVLPESGTKSGEQRSPLYHVVLLDDDDHTYEYVVEMLCQLFFMAPEKAFEHAVEVDTRGRTIVITCERPEAEFARDQIHAYGRDPRMPRSKGSMTAIIEAVYAGPG